MKLPTQRARVLAFIKEEVESGNGFPTYSMIAGAMAWKRASSAYDCLTALAGQGYLIRTYVQGEKKYRFALKPTEETTP